MTGKAVRIAQLVQAYKDWDNKDDKSTNPVACLARDNKRKINKIFEKEMHEKIDKYLIK